MPEKAYKQIKFHPKTLKMIEQANVICSEYAEQGYDLTLRQLYYQFVARGLLANKQINYNRLGEAISNARLAGLLDWSFIIDRTRSLRDLPHWDSPQDIINSAANGYRNFKWNDQDVRVEVWIEKDALVGVVDNVCTSYDVPLFACRGYTSQSELWGAAQRIERYLDNHNKRVLIIHLGDHDPSGWDMSRDIEDRMMMFIEGDGFDPDDVEIRRIALNTDQVKKYNPPPNPAKTTDSRYIQYARKYGTDSWELDALDPKILSALIEKHILTALDTETWENSKAAERQEKLLLTATARRWKEVSQFVSEN